MLSALAAMLFVVVSHQRPVPPRLVGMTDTPCTAAAMPVTGRAEDDWAGLCRYRADNARLIASGARPDVVLIGDSLTLNWQDAEPTRFGGRLINRGIGRQTSQQALLRFGADVAALHPRAVHILVGTNDALGVNGPTSLANVEANIAAMVALARASGIVPVLATAPYNPSYSKADRAAAPWIGRINDWVRGYARANRIALVDYADVLARMDNAASPLLRTDGIHPNRAGYALMARELDRALAEALSPLPS